MSDRELVLGTWEIVEMELWRKSTLDLIRPAHLTFESDGMGALGLIAVRGGIDYCVVSRDGQPAVEFSWEGLDERDQRCGRGWALVDGDTMVGRFFFHAGDDSSFIAKRVE
jgi:hypothetical protein